MGDVIASTVNLGTIIGNVTNIYGVPPKAIERLEELLSKKDIDIAQRGQIIQDWVKKYKELEQRLASASPEDTTAKKAKEKLDQGDIESAEKLFYQSLENNLKTIKEKQKAAASDAYNLASVKELKLQYPEALNYYKQTVSLEPDNTLIQNL